ncbi:hypothetical protein [Phenylobacterium sp.]|uniref:hypothetical protein n=1 Tax=Phenylobacterium sp. TaxID=1871053 RepID=UPI002FC93AD9
MTVRLYRSTDTSAPSLTGVAGTLTSLLDAILVNGYGSQTAAGWTIAYTGTNKRVYTMASGGTGYSIYVDDSAPGTGGGREARVSGWTTPTGLGAGSGQFPTPAQMAAPSGALVIRKSATADATARAWTVVADGHTFYLFSETGDFTSPFCAYPFMFGDFFTYGSTDANNCMIIGRTLENNANAGVAAGFSQASMVDAFGSIAYCNSTGLSNTLPGHFIASNYTGVGGSVPAGKHVDIAKMGGQQAGALGPMQMGFLGIWTTGSQGTGTSWTSEFNYPNSPDSGLYVSPVWIHHNGFVRGYLKGLWAPLQNHPIAHNDTYSGTGVMSGKSLLAQDIIGLSNCWNSGPIVGAAQVHIETSDTWS